VYLKGDSRESIRGVRREKREHEDVKYLDGDSRERIRGVRRRENTEKKPNRESLGEAHKSLLDLAF
jgi:hypothetical protein